MIRTCARLYKAIRNKNLVQQYPALLVSPTSTPDQLILIVPKDLWDSPKWKDDVQHMGVQILYELRVTDGMLEHGVRYTLMTRLAPEWNRVGGLMIQGTDFLSSMQRKKYKAIELSIHSNSSGQLYLKMKPEILRMYPLEEWQTTTRNTLMSQARNSSSACARHPEFTTWVYVLPKLTKAQCVGIRQGLPPETGFKNYALLKEFWWQTYGYSLPNEPPKYYYDIYFSRSRGGPPLIYPEYCVLSGLPSPAQGVSPKERDVALTAFIQILCRKMTSVCGLPLDLKIISGEMRVPKLTPLSEVGQNGTERERDGVKRKREEGSERDKTGAEHKVQKINESGFF